VSGSIAAHWRSTAKVAFYATWTDYVDDITRDAPQLIQRSELAFELPAPDGSLPTPNLDPSLYNADRFQKSEKDLVKIDTYQLALPNNTQHVFRDTRARKVDYHSRSTTRFREYFLDDQISDNPAPETTPVVVANSVRPDPVSVRYIIPAFLKESAYDKVKRIWRTQTTVVLHAYFERPMYTSGFEEQIAIAIRGKGATQLSAWGGDPTLRTDNIPGLQKQVLSKDLKHENFPGVTAVSCPLPSGETADLVPYELEWVKELGLWCAQIRIDIQQVHRPFVQLAIVRYQKNGLRDDTTAANDTRASEPIFADFLQVMPDRYISITKRSAHAYTVLVLGTFEYSTPPTAELSPITWDLDGWHKVKDRDLGWRPVESPATTITWHEGKNDGCAEHFSGWELNIQIKPSPIVHDYRLVIRERELIQDPPITADGPIPPPRFMPRFRHEIDLP
jgi:hypothetical protein